MSDSPTAPQGVVGLPAYPYADNPIPPPSIEVVHPSERKDVVTMPEGARLNCYVYLRNPETNEVKGFGPEDTVPDWARALITNEDAWATDDVQAEEPEPQPAPELTKTALHKMSKDDLIALADERGIEVGADDTKNDIVDAILAQ